MANKFRKIACILLAAGLATGVLPAAACGKTENGGQTQVTPHEQIYTVNVVGADEGFLGGLTATLLGEDGSPAAEGKQLVGGKAEFSLPDGTYTVFLAGAGLENYEVPEVTLSPSSRSCNIVLQKRADSELLYTVIVTCNDSGILDYLAVELFREDGTVVSAPKPLKRGAASFTLEKGTYTARLTDADPDFPMLSSYEWAEIVLTAESPSGTIALTAKSNEPNGTEDFPFLLETLENTNYSYIPHEITSELWDVQTKDYSKVYYNYTPEEDETYTYTTSLNCVEFYIENESGKQLLRALGGSYFNYEVFTLQKGVTYTVRVGVDNANGQYTAGEPLTWSIVKGRAEEPKITYTVQIICDEAAVLQGLTVTLNGADGSPAAEGKQLVSGKAEFTLAHGAYTVEIAGVPAGYTYSARPLSEQAVSVTVVLVSESAVKKFAGGSGTEADPYRVSSLDGLYSVPTVGDEYIYIKCSAPAAGEYALSTTDNYLGVLLTQGFGELVKFYHGGADRAWAFTLSAEECVLRVTNFAQDGVPLVFTVKKK